jgi:glycine/D-amino acid oxidase-like deaminating enzyme
VRDGVEIDVAVFGGGIAGLWLLRRLRKLGFDALLFEKQRLGFGQTIASQGIIHSGVKYTFDGVNRPQTEALSAMPKIWMDCIAGHGEVDLRGTQILAEHQLMFTTGGLFNRAVGALAARALRSDVRTVAREDWPEVFCAREFSGTIYRLEEPVLAAKTVLAKLNCPAVHQAAVKEIRREGERVSEIVFNDADSTHVRPRACIFTSGEGNEWFAEQLGLDKSKTAQRRPLRMILARGVPCKLFAHCLVPEPKPRVTITTHDLKGENIWYLGGNIAEKAVGMREDEALRWAYSEMAALFPWLDWKKVRWAIHDVDRAEPLANKLLPGGPTLWTAGNAALAWPTKLALAPALAQQALRWLEQEGATPSHRTTELSLPLAEPARYPWEEVREWIQF